MKSHSCLMALPILLLVPAMVINPYRYNISSILNPYIIRVETDFAVTRVINIINSAGIRADWVVSKAL